MLDKNYLTINSAISKTSPYIEAVADEVIYVGRLCLLTANGHCKVNDSENSNSPMLIATEDIYTGKSVEAGYAIGARVQLRHLRCGDVFLSRLEAGNVVTDAWPVIIGVTGACENAASAVAWDGSMGVALESVTEGPGKQFARISII